MKNIGYIMLIGSVLCLLGTIGAIEHSGLSIADGIVRSVVCLALAWKGIKIIEAEEN